MVLKKANEGWSQEVWKQIHFLQMFGPWAFIKQKGNTKSLLILFAW